MTSHWYYFSTKIHTITPHTHKYVCTYIHMFVYVHICIERNNGILYTHLIHGRQPIQTILERLSAQGGKAI